jgi:hypothetical protein
MNSVNGDSPKSNSRNGINGGEIFIHRLDRKTNFTKIDNGIRDSGLSLAAIGLHTYLQTLPQDWRINCDHIMHETGMGEDAFFPIWNELKDAGYIVVRPTRGPRGRYGKPKIYVYPVPQQHLSPGKPDSGHLSPGLPDSGKPGVRINRSPDNPDSNKDRKVTKTRKEQRREREEEESPSGILSGPVEDNHHSGQSESDYESESGHTAGQSSGGESVHDRAAQPSGTGPNSVNGGGAAEVGAAGVNTKRCRPLTTEERMEPYRARFPHIDVFDFSNAETRAYDFGSTLESELAKCNAAKAEAKRRKAMEKPDDIVAEYGVIKVTRADMDRWRTSFRHIPNIEAEIGPLLNGRMTRPRRTAVTGKGRLSGP